MKCVDVPRDSGEAIAELLKPTFRTPELGRGPMTSFTKGIPLQAQQEGQAVLKTP